MTTEFSDRELDYLTKSAREKATEAFDTVIDRLESALREAKRDRERLFRCFEEQDAWLASDRTGSRPFYPPQECLASLINNVQWVVPNMRLDLIPSIYAQVQKNGEMREQAANAAAMETLGQ